MRKLSSYPLLWSTHFDWRFLLFVSRICCIALTDFELAEAVATRGIAFDYSLSYKLEIGRLLHDTKSHHDTCVVFSHSRRIR